MRGYTYQLSHFLSKDKLESIIERLDPEGYIVRTAQEFKHLEGEREYDNRGGDYAVFTTGETIKKESV